MSIHKKSGVSEKTPLRELETSELAAAAAVSATSGRTASGRGAAAACAFSATDRIFGLNDETIIGHVDGYLAGLGLQFLVDEEGKSSGLNYFVFVVRLIQSQCQLGACSAASREINADRGLIFVLKVSFKLLCCSLGDFDHNQFLL